jgi:uncharacterized repeat protein (TIGR01451 family)
MSSGNGKIVITYAVADLSIEKTDNGGGVFSSSTNNTTGGAATAGSPVTYTIVVANNGPGDVTGASIADTLPAILTGVNYTATSTTASGFTSSGSGNIADTSVNLPSGSTVTYTVHATLSPSATGSLVNTATVNPPGSVNDTNAANNASTDTQTVASPADLAVTKSGPSTAAPGSNITYAVSVRNDGPSAASGATLTDALPAGTTFVSVTPPLGWTCPSPPSVAVGSNGTVICSTTDSLAAGAPAASFSIVAHVGAGTVGQLSNAASVSSTTPDPDSSNNTSPAVHTTVACDRTMTGTVGANPSISGPGTTCVSGATLSGNLSVSGGASVVVVNSTIKNLSATNPGSVTVCNSTVETLSVSGASGFVAVGDPGDDACPANTINGTVTLSSNHGGLDLIGNRIAKNTYVNGTSGTGPFPEDIGAEIEANSIGGNLSCSGNAPPPTNDGHANSVSGNRSGQCAAGGFV